MGKHKNNEWKASSRKTNYNLINLEKNYSVSGFFCFFLPGE